MSMAELKTAADLRRVINKMVSTAIDKKRPEFRVGRVWSFDISTQVAQVLFPGNETLVPVKFALDKVPTNTILANLADGTSLASGLYGTIAGKTTADVVRVAGKPGDWFILDYITGSPIKVVSVMDELVDSDIKFAYSTLVVTALSVTQVVSLEHNPIPESIHVYWGGAFLTDDQWTLNGHDVIVQDDEQMIAVGRELTVKYAWNVRNQVLETSSILTMDIVGPIYEYLHGAESAGIVGGITALESLDDDTTYVWYGNPGRAYGTTWHLFITFPPTIIPGRLISTSVVTRMKGPDGRALSATVNTPWVNLTKDTGAVYGHWDPRGVIEDSADYETYVVPLVGHYNTVSGLMEGSEEFVTQEMIEAGTVEYNPGEGLYMVANYANPASAGADLRTTYVALRVTYEVGT